MDSAQLIAWSVRDPVSLLSLAFYSGRLEALTEYLNISKECRTSKTMQYS